MAINESGLSEGVLQRLVNGSQFVIAEYQPPDPWQRFLCTRSDWPGRRCAAENCDELAPLHEDSFGRRVASPQTIAVRKFLSSKIGSGRRPVSALVSRSLPSGAHSRDPLAHPGYARYGLD